MTGTPSFISRLIPLRLPRVCVPVTGSDATDLVDKAEALVRDNTFLEFRLDYLSHPAQALPKIKRFTEYHPQVVVIATCRRQTNGGKFRGSLGSQLEVLSKAASEDASCSTSSCKAPRNASRNNCSAFGAKRR